MSSVNKPGRNPFLWEFPPEKGSWPTPQRIGALFAFYLVCGLGTGAIALAVMLLIAKPVAVLCLAAGIVIGRWYRLLTPLWVRATALFDVRRTVRH